MPLVEGTPALLLMDLNHSKVKCNEVQCTLLWMLQSNVISFRLLWQYQIFVSLISWNDLKRSVNPLMSYHVKSSQRLVTFWRWKTSPYVDHAVMWNNYLYDFCAIVPCELNIFWRLCYKPSTCHILHISSFRCQEYVIQRIRSVRRPNRVMLYKNGIAYFNKIIVIKLMMCIDVFLFSTIAFTI